MAKVDWKKHWRLCNREGNGVDGETKMARTCHSGESRSPSLFVGEPIKVRERHKPLGSRLDFRLDPR